MALEPRSVLSVRRRTNRQPKQVLTVALSAMLVATVLGFDAPAQATPKPTTPKPAESIGTAVAGEESAKGRPAPALGEVATTSPVATDLPKSSDRQVSISEGIATEPGTTSGFVDGHSTEIAEERDAKKKVFANPDGTRTAEFSTKPIHAKDDKGRWQNIDTTLERKSGRIKNKVSRIGVDLAERANDTKVESIRLQDGSEISFKIDGARDVPAEVDGKVALYRGVFDRVDVRYTSEDWGVKEDLILHSRDVPDTYTFPLDLKGLTAKIDEQTKDVVFVDKSGEVKGRMTHGWMEDSNIDPHAGQGALSDGIAFELIPWENNRTAVVMHVDRAWLDDPARVYPITVDPTTVDVAAASDDTFVMSGFTANSAGVNPLKVGTYDGGAHVGAAYVRFDGVNSLANTRILGSTYYSYNSHSWSCDPRGLGIYRVTQAWNGTTMTGWPGATYGERVLWAPFAMGYSAACPAGWAYWSSDVNPAFDDLVKGWVNGTVPNFGLTLRVDPGSEHDNVAYKKFNSTEGGGQILKVTYSPYGASYSPASSFTTVPTNTTAGSVKVTVANTGRDCWPTNGNFRLSYHLYDSNNNLLRWDNSRTFLPQQVCRGGNVQLNAVVDPLAPGSYKIAWDMVEEGARWFSTNEQVPTVNQTVNIGNVAPQITSAFPLNGAVSQSSIVSLGVTGSDPDNWPNQGLEYNFKICTNAAMTAGCTDSGTTSQPTWKTPALYWNQPYYWQGRVSDRNAWSAFTSVTNVVARVSQPPVDSHLGSDAYAATTGGANLAVGNFVAPMTDAVVGGIGPALQVDRSYNSLSDTNGPFGVGWVFNFASRVDREPSGTLLVTFPDGRKARLGLNPDNTYVNPPGYFLSVIATSGESRLVDKTGTAWVYDVTGKLTRVVSATGIGLDLAYDGSGQLVQITNATTLRHLYFTWSGSHITRVTTDAPAAGSSGYAWDYTYTGNLLTSACNPKPAGSDCSMYRYSTVNGRSLLTQIVMPRGNAAADIGYATDGTVAWRTDGAGKRWTFAATTNAGVRTVTMTDPRNNASTYTFDSAGRLASYKDAQNNTKTFTYNDAGYLAKVTDALGHSLELGTDIRGNIVRRTTERGGQFLTSYYSYFLGAPGDPRNDKPTEERDARSSGPTDNRYLTTTSYDARGLVTSKTAPGGRTTTWSYSTGTEAAFDGNGLTPGGLALATTDPAGKTTTFAYDRKGDLRRVVDPVGLRTDLSYDNLGRKLLTTEISDTYPAGLITAFTYDELNQVISETKPTVTNDVTNGARTARTEYTYDPNGNVTSQSVFDIEGRDARQTTTFAYDNADRLITTTNANGGVEARSYDAAGNVASLTSPGGVRRSFTYTSRNELANTMVESFVDDPTTSTPARNLVVEQRNYDGAGRLSTVADAFGRTRQFQYYNDDSLAAVWLLGFRNADGTTRNVMLESFSYDGAGNRTQESYDSGIHNITKSYDPASRLSSETLDPSGLARTNTYSYDANDNVTKVITTQPGSSTESRYTYDAANRAISTTIENGTVDLTTTYTYDRRGALISTVDPRGNVAGADPNSYKTTFVNDQLGRQIAKTSPVVPVETGVSNTSTSGLVAKINFQAQSTSTPVGYQGDYGQAYDATRGYGWETLSGSPVSLVGNGRERNVLADKRLDTYMHMQLLPEAPGVHTEGRWQLDVPNGSYNLTVGLGDPSYLNSRHVIRAESSTFADFTPTAIEPVKIFTSPVTITDGRLTLDAIGGTNTKLSYLDLNTVSTTPPPSNGPATENIALTAKVGYDTFGNVIASTGPDSSDGVVTYTYDKLNRLTTKTTPFGSTPAIERRSYDPDGNVVSETNARGYVTTHVYDLLGRVVRTTDPKLSNQPSAGFSKFRYDDVGNLVEFVDQRGAKTTFTYDDLDRQTTKNVVERVPSSTTFTTRYNYDDAGRLTSVVDPLGKATTAQYNAADEQTAQRDPLGKLTTSGRDVAGRLTQVVDPLGRKTVNTYDPAGRLTSVSNYDAGGSLLRIESFGYDAAGNETTLTSPNGWTTTRSYDALSHLLSITEPVTATKQVTTRFGYDRDGNRTSITNGNGATTLTSYNELNLVSSVVEPSTPAHPDLGDRTWSYTYDAGGLQTRAQAPGGVVRTRTFDELGRQTYESGTGGAGAATGRTLGYDLVGNITSVGAPGTPQTFVRNDRGQITSQSGPVGNASFAYDGNGQLVSRTNVAGTTSFTYSARGELTTVTDPVTAATFTYSYDDAGQKTATAAGATQRTYNYDGLGRLTLDQIGDSASSNWRSVSYGYDANSNVTSKTLAAAGSVTQSNTYAYDRSDRLTSWTATGITTPYEWDDAGNRTRNGADIATYDARNRLVSDTTGGGTTYSHTPRGTLLTEARSGGNVSLEFDSFDRIISDSSDPGTTFKYDAFDRLFSRNGVSFRYDGEDIHPTADGTQTYVRDPGGNPLSVAQGTTKLALISDQHGDVIGSFVPGGSVTANTAIFDPFGKKTTTTGFAPSLGYQGSWTNASSSAQRTWMWSRWYSPGQGNFASRDRAHVPVTSGVSTNLFTYANANPVTFNDPRGEVAMAIPVAAGIARVGLGRLGLALAGASATAGTTHYVQNNPQEIPAISMPSWGWSGTHSTTRSRTTTAPVSDSVPTPRPLTSSPSAPAPSTTSAKPATRSTHSTTSRVQTKARPAAPPKIYPPAPPVPASNPAYKPSLNVIDLSNTTVLSTGTVTATELPVFVVPDAVQETDCGKTSTCFGPQALVQAGLVDAALGGPFNQFDPSDDDTCPIASLAVDAITMSTGGDGIFLPCGSASDQARSAVGGKGGAGHRSPGGTGGGRSNSGDLNVPGATGTANNVVRYDPDFAIGQIAQNGRARATDIIDFGMSQGWRRIQTATGPIKFMDENGVVRLTIKSGSQRAPGSGSPHIEIRNADGQRIDVYGNRVSRRSPGNHTPVIWDLGP